MARWGWICVCVLVVAVLDDVSVAARTNRSRSASLIFPDYPPSSLHSKEAEDNGDWELKTFHDVETKMKGLIDDVIKKVLPFVIRSSADIRLSGKCMASIFKMVLGMQKLQEWAIRMVDATGKPPSGLFQGTSMSLGDFDECINVRVGPMGKPPPPGEREYFHGKYCTVECSLPKGLLSAIDEYEKVSPSGRHNTSLGTSKTFLSMLLKYGQYLKVAAFRFGVCIPSTCGEQDLSSITTTIGKHVGFPLKVLHCQEKKKIEFTVDQSIILLVLLLIVGIVLFFTAVEAYFLKYQVNPVSKFQSVLYDVSRALSAVNNTKKLIRLDTDNHPVPVLRGLFLITVVFNILGHTYLLYNHLFFFKYSSVINYYDYMQQFSFTFIANGSNGVENYFFIAGFLITYIRWKKADKTPNINILKLILKPYIRMTLLQLLTIALFLLIPLIGYGPFWGDFVGPYLQNCRERWWMNLFYVHNYWSSDHTCLYHTWLLAAIMQLYVLAIFIVWLLIKKPNIGFCVVIVIIVAGMAGVGAVVFVHKLPGALSMYLLDGVTAPRMWNTLFIKTFDHVGAFAIGMVTGYLLVKHRESLKFNKVTATVIWCIAIASVLAVLFGLYEYRNGNVKMEPSLSLLYAMLNRNVYALFIAWFVIACFNGQAGYLSNMLSWKALIPAYRLSFLAYLLHLIIIYYHIGILRERMYLSHEENILNYFGYLVSTFILAYACYIFFQAPYMYLESLMLTRRDEDDSDNDAEDIKRRYNDNLSLSAKSIKRQMHNISINAIEKAKDSHILTSIQTCAEKSRM